MAQHGHSAACCTIPPIVSTGYTPKGEYQTINGLKTYVTGPADATKGIFIVYDIFGFFPQTLQGADILATADESNKYRVFIPDVLDGQVADISWYPPDTEEKGKLLGNFFQTVGAPPTTAGKIAGLQSAFASKNPDLNKWYIIGFCWGGKIVSMNTSSSSTPFTAAAECHPAMVDPKEATDIKIPLCMLASMDEPVDDVKQFEANLAGDKHVEIFSDQIHGWMAARADLKDSKVKAEYERGYKTILEFFAKY